MAASATEPDLSAWYAGKDFTADWTSHNFPVWAALLAARRGEALDVLEVGSWEGRSALIFLNFLPRCRLTCIDTFAGSMEHEADPDWVRNAKDSERRFDANMAEFSARVEKIKARSPHALGGLAIAQRRFDLVYIDGSHHSADVYADAMLAWPLLKEDAIVIFDDYEWTQMPDDAQRPKLGIDAFLTTMTGRYTELHRGYQVVVQKRPPAPVVATV